jgi:ribosomal protein RSM22 (predicted rRNA methylase)
VDQDHREDADLAHLLSGAANYFWLARTMAESGSLPVAIEAGLRGHGAASLSAGVRRLMEAYRSGEAPATPVLASSRDAAAYAAYRMPATVAATAAAFAELRLALPGWTPARVLDFGAGTGGASWAVATALGAVGLTLLEQSADAIRLGRSILAQSKSASLREATWRSWQLSSLPLSSLPPNSLPPSSSGLSPAGSPQTGIEPADLAVSAYVLGELSGPQQEHLVTLAAASAPVVLLVEPGTPAGHERILAARELLMAAGYAIAAPCPHQLGCPLAAAGDWCHFAARVQRSALHRQAKGAELSYEDEKFSYVAAAAPPAGRPDHPDGRVVRRPQQRKNLVILDLCLADGRSSQLLVGKSKGESYRRARKISWGDRWADDAAGG